MSPGGIAARVYRKRFYLFVPRGHSKCIDEKRVIKNELKNSGIKFKTFYLTLEGAVVLWPYHYIGLVDTVEDKQYSGLKEIRAFLENYKDKEKVD